MRFGVNYIPSREWQYSWVDFDENSIRKDLHSIKEVGLDHLRVNLLWNFFQLDCRRMSPLAMKNLEKFVAICEEVGLDFFLSLFTGWMSGFYFFPHYMNTQKGLSMFSDKNTYEQQRFYIRQIGSVVAKSPRFLGFDLGNELSMLTSLDKDCTIEIADSWQREMFAVCEEVAPNKLHNNGVDNQPWFYPRKLNAPTAFSREGLSNEGAITPLHCYPLFTGCIEKSGLFGPHSTHLIDYMCQLALAYSFSPERPVWIQEINCCPDTDTQTVVKFTKETLETIVKIPNMWGVTWWGSHDISREFSVFNEIEYELGILDINNNLKPAGQVIKDFIAEYKQNPISVSARETAMVYDPELDQKDPWAQMEKFIALCQEVGAPALVLKDKAEDPLHLAARKIKTIIK